MNTVSKPRGARGELSQGVSPAASRGRFLPPALQFAAVFGVVLALSVPIAPAAVVAAGSVSDPAGDATSGKADFTSASISIDHLGNITFSAQFVSNSFNPSTDSIMFLLDRDASVSTGVAYPNAPGLGVDAFFDALAPGFGLAAVWNGSIFQGGPVNFTPMPVDDGYIATLPLSTFGAISPGMKFSVTSIAPAPEISRFQDATPVGVVTGSGSPPVAGVPDTGSSALLFSVAVLGLVIGKRVRAREAGADPGRAVVGTTSEIQS